MAEGKTTISVIKADVGSIGGHIKPSQRLLERVAEFIEQEGRDLLTDSFSRVVVGGCKGLIEHPSPLFEITFALETGRVPIQRLEVGRIVGVHYQEPVGPT